MIVRIEDGSLEQVEALGLKGAYLCDMARMGFDVPPGFIIPTRMCKEFFERGGKISGEVFDDIKGHLSALEEKTGRRYGGSSRPLLVSVRSGAAVPMPGMMDTLLNLGMTPVTFQALLEETGDPRFVYSSYCRFIRMYGQIVLGIESREFEHSLQIQSDRAGVSSSEGFNQQQLKKLSENYLSIIRKSGGKDIPEDPYEQIRAAVEAVFLSWNSPRAKVYRNLRRVPEIGGTAVVVQAMVYGNRDAKSAVGLAMTRDPIIGIKRLFVEYLGSSQGEEIREGARAPKTAASLKEEMPDVYDALAAASEKLEKKYRAVQEIEFTVESGRLYFLQTRSAECTAHATIRAAVDMVSEGLLTREEALLKVDPESLQQILHRYIDPNVQMRSLVRGIGASPGAAAGIVAFSAQEVLNLKEQHKESILVRPDTRIEDAAGIEAANGILLSKGSRSSHAAVAARRMGKPCVAGCAGMMIDLENKKFTVGNTTVRAGDVITIDGGTGRVFSGTVPMMETTIGEEFNQLLSWADEVRTLRVYANADTPEDAQRGINFGAEGIGLCRTEAMFMAGDRLPIMQTLILADEESEQKKMLAKLQRVQREDFIEIFRHMKGKPVVFRLLDPPLHGFIPELEPLMNDVYDMRAQFASGEAASLKEALLRKVLSHREINPMLGLRGVRLGILRPEIVIMQVSAVFEAACEVLNEDIPVSPEILIPLVGHVNELKKVKEVIEQTAKQVTQKNRKEIAYRIGVLVEVPRAALTAADLALNADFFSFGTNDLTQMTFGLSRDDSEHKFLLNYLNQRILDDNPFQTLDPEGVGRLIRIAVEDGRKTNPEISLGLCGEQGADPKTILFCQDIGMDYISSSPYQVPIARLAAAQAAIRTRRAADTSA